MKCFNCACIQTPLWRRGPSGEQLCNACGIYYKNHVTHRSMPVKMKSSASSRKNASQSKARSIAGDSKKKRTKPRVKHTDVYDMVSGFPGGHDSEVFAAHVLIKLSYDVYMRTPERSSHHSVPMHVASHVTRSGVTSPYEAHTPPPGITATS